jgi:hypothetical protein
LGWPKPRRSAAASTAAPPPGRSTARGGPASPRPARTPSRAEKLDKPPEWKSTINRAGIAAIVFAVLVVALFQRPIVSGLLLGVVMFAIYVPLGYATDSSIYRFRNRRKLAQAADREAQKK